METCHYQEFNKMYSTCTLRFEVLMVVYIRRMSWAAGHHAYYIHKVVPNICGSSAWNLLHVMFLVSRIIKWLLNFWKICAPLMMLIIFFMIMIIIIIIIITVQSV